MRKGFKILALSFLAILVIAAATLWYANRPRVADRGEIQALINSKVCHGMPCPIPDGSDWLKVEKNGKSINVDATLEVPRAALKIGVPRAYPKPEGNVEINLQGVLVGDPEFKILPTPPGEDLDYLRVRPVAGVRELIKSEWDTASLGTLRTDLALLSESLEVKDQEDARKMVLELALTRGNNEQLQQDLQALNPWNEPEYKPLADMMRKEMTSTKDPERKEIIAPKLKEYDKIVSRLAQAKNRSGRQGGGRPGTGR